MRSEDLRLRFRSFHFCSFRIVDLDVSGFIFLSLSLDSVALTRICSHVCLVAPWCHFRSHLLVLSSVCLQFFFGCLSRSVSLFCHSFLNLARCRSRASSRFLSVSFSLFPLPFLSVAFFLTLSLFLSLSFYLSLSVFLSDSLFLSSLSLCVSPARARDLLFRICTGRTGHRLRKLCSGARKVFVIGLLSLITRTVLCVY